MPSNVKYNKSSGLIEIVYRGDVTISEVKENALRRIAIQKETGAMGILADTSEARTAPKISDLFNLADSFYPEQNMPRGSFIAIVLPKANQPQKMVKFLETASKNRGWLMHVFEDRQSATAWLMEQTTSIKSLEDTSQ